MAGKSDQTELLAQYIERWLSQSPRRSMQMLSRNSGVPYPTIRRVMQREGEQTLETALSILNLVASLEETLDYLSPVESVRKFYEKVSSRTTVAKQEMLEKFVGKDSFWVMALALTIGATKARVQNLLGSSGLAVMDDMISEGFLRESEFEIYRANSDCSTYFFHSSKVGRETVRHVNEMPASGRFFEQVVVCNVSEEGLNILMDSLKVAFDTGAEVAKNHEGDILVGFSYVGKEILRSEVSKGVLQ
ncbi:MAG TPA: hypothetical protein VE954_42520 [Oligoflexus sp.]|uniref:hypothetical protein n=1 Tax=Oligoflexus sp. TaxID=1971216 RepID=UPI002D612D37|nr:hypothetical protein [Oligoflexus sp.]HYX39810.1 hypothetical protein [Oligoflexus sp.]HYX39817.1 hypothetical protein [Oligoflexus sp.]